MSLDILILKKQQFSKLKKKNQSKLPLQVIKVIPKLLSKPRYSSLWSRVLDSCCIPSVPLCIARAPLENKVKEGCSYSYDLEIVTDLYEKKKKKKNWNTHDWNNDLQVGCFITNSFPCVHGVIAGGVKHLNILSDFQCFLLSMITSFIWGGDMEFPGVLKKEQVESPGVN